MGIYDQLLGVTQQGLNNLSQTAQVGASQPTMADVFMDRFRQGGQERLAQQKAAEQARMNEATMKNMEAQRLIQGAQMMSLYGNEQNAPMMKAVGAKIGMPEVPVATGLKDRELGVKVDQFDRGLESKEKIASEGNDTKAYIASLAKDKKEKPIKLVQVLQHIADGDIVDPEQQRAALKWATYTTPAPAIPATLTPVMNRETGQEQLIRPDREGKGVIAVDPKYAPRDTKRGVGGQSTKFNPDDVMALLDEADNSVKKASGSLGGMMKTKVQGLAGISTDETRANSEMGSLQAQLMMNLKRMEGPQSDKDVQLYKEQAGRIGDPMVPMGDKQAALRLIRKLTIKFIARMKEAGKVPGGGEDGIVEIKDDAGFAALKPKQRFKGPDGIVRVK